MKRMVNGFALDHSSNNGFAPGSSAARATPAGTADSRDADSRSSRGKVVQAIVRGLYEGRYRPGQRLVEAELTAEYGISRGPVREALNRLAVIGAVTLRPQSGAHVRKLDVDEAIDILLVASALLRLAARLAAERLEDIAAERLQRAATKVAQFAVDDDNAEFALARSAFYDELVCTAGSREIARYVPTVQIHLIRRQFGVALKPSNVHRHAAYARICDAVLRGDPDAADAAIEAHFRYGIDALRLLRRG